MLVRILLVFLVSLLFVGESEAKSWRGIVPLKSTRADVERLLGKEDSFGRYQFADERAYIQYREDPCLGAYRPLRKDSCECLVSTETVVSIHVTLEVTRSFSSLRLDKTKYERRPHPGRPFFVDYASIDEGVTYTLDESDGDLLGIGYGPSAADCKELIARNTPTYRNSWRGLIPLHSNRTDVERLLGPPTNTSYDRYVYYTDNETVSVIYSKGGCKPGDDEWNVPLGVMLQMSVSPTPAFEMRQLRLDPQRFQRQESPPLPENLGKLVNYTDQANGVIVRASNDGRSETIISITYAPSRKDERLRCEKGKAAQ